jgi:hypothetical protein
MTRLLVAALVWLGLAGSAAAQAPGQSAPAGEPPMTPWTQPPPPPPSTPPGTGLQQALGSGRAEGDQRDSAELEFNRRSIRFGATYDLRAAGNYSSVNQRWTAYQGGIAQRLSNAQFYQVIGHPELVDSVAVRRRTMVFGFVVGGVAAGSSFFLWAYNEARVSTDNFDCEFNHQSQCVHRDVYTGPLILGAISAVSFITAIYLVSHLQPLDETEAKQAAQVYNQHLRQELGLPVATRQPLVHDLKVAPYFSGRDAGLGLSARF